MALTDRARSARPYVERLLDDHELQRDLREALSAMRGGYGRAKAKRRRPTRLLGDRRLKQNAQRALASLKDAGARLRGEPPKRHRGRRVLIILVIAGAVAAGARELMKEGDEAPPVA